VLDIPAEKIATLVMPGGYKLETNASVQSSMEVDNETADRFAAALGYAFRQWSVLITDFAPSGDGDSAYGVITFAHVIAAPDADAFFKHAAGINPALGEGFTAFDEEMFFLNVTDAQGKPQSGVDDQTFIADLGRAAQSYAAQKVQMTGTGRADARFLGVGLPTNGRPPRFEVHSARIAHRAGPDGFVEPRLMLGLLQEHQVPLEADHSAGAMTFESGCTIVAELRTPRVLYCIRKRAESATRLERQRSFAAVAGTSIRATYLGAGGLLNDGGENEPFALLHRGAS